MKDTVSYKEILGLLFLLFVLYLCTLPRGGFEGDLACWRVWSTYMLQNGFGAIYNSPADYHPIYLYCLNFFQLFQGTEELIVKHLHFTKAFPLLFDFLGALLIWSLPDVKTRKLLLPLYLVLNIAYMYNTLLWGQVDSMPTFFVLAMLIAFFKRWTILAILAFVLAINTKLQVIIYFPIFLLLLLPDLIQRPKKLLQGLGAGLVLQVLILIPFWMAGTLDGLYRVIFGAVNRHPYISLNAYNLWYLIYWSGDPNVAFTEDSRLLLGWSCKRWGYLFFFVVSGISLIPIGFRLLRHTLDRHFAWAASSFELILLTSAIITLEFFFLNTQMHERYSHPALLLLFAYSVYRKNYSLFTLCCFAYVLNLEKVLHAFQIHNYGTFIFDPRMLALVFLLILVLAIRRLWTAYDVRGDIQAVRGVMKI